MPKVGIEPIRKQQLIEATLISVEQNGLQGTTISTISKIAGMSSGIISHYFGGKQGLIEATVRYLLDQLKSSLLNHISRSEVTPRERLFCVVEANFSHLQQSSAATRTWLSFWSQAMHDANLSRLQRVNNQRLVSNLKYSFRQFMDPADALQAAKMTAAMIDGFWLRSALSETPGQDFHEAETMCKHFIDQLITDSSQGKLH